jgi:hypothetical protein
MEKASMINMVNCSMVPSFTQNLKGRQTDEVVVKQSPTGHRYLILCLKYIYIVLYFV